MTPQRRLTLAVALPPVVWAGQGLFGWFVASHACPGTAQPWSLTTARWLVVAATILGLGVSVPGLAAAFRRREGKNGDGERVHYLSMTGLLVGATLTLGLILAGLPALMLSACGEMR
jgi:heme/copper-type cytochrome/quinol oxidase subunit 2